MTIGDTIHDTILLLIKQLKTQYKDYVDTRKDIIVEMVAHMLLATHLSDRMGLPEGTYTNREIAFWRTYAVEMYDNEQDED